MAATVAIDLSKEFPKASDESLAEAAWAGFRDRGAAQFSATQYLAEVKRAMQEIRAGRMQRVEHSPDLLDKAGAHLKSRDSR